MRMRMRSRRLHLGFGGTANDIAICIAIGIAVKRRSFNERGMNRIKMQSTPSTRQRNARTWCLWGSDGQGVEG